MKVGGLITSHGGSGVSITGINADNGGIEVGGDITSIIVSDTDEINGGGYGVLVKGGITSYKNAIQVGQE